MERLIAQYEIKLVEPLVVKHREGNPLAFSTTIEDFGLTVPLDQRFGAGARSRSESTGLATVHPGAWGAWGQFT
jgi:hypothetical protein